MIIRTILLSYAVCLLAVSQGVAGNEEMIIQMISTDIKNTEEKQKKSTLHIYRARQYAKIKKWEDALDDYSTALELDHKGWIHLERSQFLLGMEKYELAYEDANAAKEEVPTLAAEADKVIEEAVAVIRERYEAANPETIIMNTRVDRYRKTRFDVMREQGVFRDKERMIAASNTQRTEKRKQQYSKAKSASAPRARS